VSALTKLVGRRGASVLGGLSDEELMRRVGDGDAAAFEFVYDRHSRAAYALAYRIVGSRPSAEEAVQEGFLAVWRGAARYRPDRGSVGTWVLGIVHHRAVDVLRRSMVVDRRRGSAEGIEERLVAPEHTEREALAREETREVRGALATLPEPQRRVLELAYYGGFTQTEIASMIDAPLGTVKGRMRLGLEKLQGELGEAV
jgi:RNA polymerase sigma-70 factor (ECF subfamily)